MKIDNFIYKDDQFEIVSESIPKDQTPDIVFLFGDSDLLNQTQTFQNVKQKFPSSHLVGCSSSGNILGDEISKHPLVASAVKFETSHVEVHSLDIQDHDNLEEKTYELLNKLPKDGLKHVFLLSDGLKVNGSKLVQGANKALENVTVTGGLAGDGARFAHTYTLDNNGVSEGKISVVGFYGEKLTITSGCFGGWDEFGVERTITKATDNILFEIDGEPALDLYKRYLGEYAKDLPNSGLRFPLSIKKDDNDSDVIRTLLGIDEDAKSIIFAGDVPEGYVCKLMKPDSDALIEGAARAAMNIEKANEKDALGLVVSCVGRKIVLGQLIDEELEEVAQVLGENVHLVGFYSYGEIAPMEKEQLLCKLHNQTMTLTAIFED